MDQIERLYSAMPQPVRSKIRGIYFFDLGGRPTAEIVVRSDPMLLFGRSPEKAIAETRVQTQAWAISYNAPTDFEGNEIIYRTADCSESPASKSDDHEIARDGNRIVEFLRMIISGTVAPQGLRPPLEQAYMAAGFLCRGIGGAPDDGALIFGGVPQQGESVCSTFADTNTPAIADATRDDVQQACHAALLLQNGFSHAFAADFTGAIAAAKRCAEAIDDLDELKRHFDDECEDPINMEHYGRLSEIEGRLIPIFVACFSRHAAEWARIVSYALFDPGLLGFQPDQRIIRRPDDDSNPE